MDRSLERAAAARPWVGVEGGERVAEGGCELGAHPAAAQGRRPELQRQREEAWQDGGLGGGSALQRLQAAAGGKLAEGDCSSYMQ